MEVTDMQFDPQQLIEMGAVLGGLGVSAVLAFLLVRRARAARLRQIEGLGSAPMPTTPRRVEGKRRKEDRAEESENDELPASDSKREPERAPGPDGEHPPESEPEAPSSKEAAPGGSVLPSAQPALSGAPEAAREPFEPAQIPGSDSSTAGAPPRAKKRRDAAALAPGLARTRSGWISRLGELFAGKREIDPALLDEVEKVLLTADIGVRTSDKLLEELRASLSRRELNNPEAAWTHLRRRTTELLSWDAAAVRWDSAKPFVLLVIGVNGSGKTTTIGKLAAKLIADGKKVLVGAGDTFRAAAVEQLEIWAKRVGAPVVRGKEGADPSSVLFDAVKRARAEGFDVVIADTAGRLHTKTDLMEELQKVRRVIAKAAEGAPHETWLVIDSTSGQNAIAQAQMFTQAMAVSGIVLTKLDGTAKGGVILGIADQLRIPVRFIGVGERVEDLREFDAEEFVEALYEQ